MDLFEKICYRHYAKFLSDVLKKFKSNKKLNSCECDFLRFLCSVVREPSFVSQLTDSDLISFLNLK